MPRSRGGPARSAPSRPSAPAPSRPAPQQQQTRSMTTTAPATRPGQQAPAAQQSQGPGLFGQMASTAAGVAVGSSIGHAIGGFFGGGSSSTQAPEQPYDSYAAQNQAMDSSLYNSSTAATTTNANQGPCAMDIKNFTSCMEQNKGDLNICGWYMEQLKACQAASRGY